MWFDRNWDGNLLSIVESHRQTLVLLMMPSWNFIVMFMLWYKKLMVWLIIYWEIVDRSPDFMVSHFVSHISPVLDYCSKNVGISSAPVDKKDWWTCGFVICILLVKIEFVSIYGRLVKSDFIKYYKAFDEDFVDVGLSRMFTEAPNAQTCEHGLKLHPPRCTSDVKKLYFFVD